MDIFAYFDPVIDDAGGHFETSINSTASLEKKSPDGFPGITLLFPDMPAGMAPDAHSDVPSISPGRSSSDSPVQSYHDILATLANFAGTVK